MAPRTRRASAKDDSVKTTRNEEEKTATTIQDGSATTPRRRRDVLRFFRVGDRGDYGVARLEEPLDPCLALKPTGRPPEARNYGKGRPPEEREAAREAQKRSSQDYRARSRRKHEWLREKHEWLLADRARLERRVDRLERRVARLGALVETLGRENEALGNLFWGARDLEAAVVLLRLGGTMTTTTTEGEPRCH